VRYNFRTFLSNHIGLGDYEILLVVRWLDANTDFLSTQAEAVREGAASQQ
jgi:hypothetical protein